MLEFPARDDNDADKTTIGGISSPSSECPERNIRERLCFQAFDSRLAGEPIPEVQAARMKSEGGRMHKSQIFILPMLVSVSLLVIGTGCGKSTTAAAVTPPHEVCVAGVEQRDVLLYKEWVGTLDGFVNATSKLRLPVT
jgi:hypothetical protein